MYAEEQLLGPNMRSRDSAVSTHMRFENRTGEYVRIFWWNYEGQKVAYRTLPPNTAYRQQSFVSHPWTYKCIPFAPSGRPRRFSEADELVVVDDRLVAFPEAEERPYVLRKPTMVEWSPQRHGEFYPPAFKEAVRALLLCHHRLRHEPLEKKRTHRMVTRSRGPAEDPHRCVPAPTGGPGGGGSLNSHRLDDAVFQRNCSLPRRGSADPCPSDFGSLPAELALHIVKRLAPPVPYILPALPQEQPAQEELPEEEEAEEEEEEEFFSDADDFGLESDSEGSLSGASGGDAPPGGDGAGAADATDH